MAAISHHPRNRPLSQEAAQAERKEIDTTHWVQVDQITVRVAGHSHWCPSRTESKKSKDPAQPCCDFFGDGAEVILEREAGNPRDATAVRVLHLGSWKKLGFVPKEHSPRFWKALGPGSVVKGTLSIPNPALPSMTLSLLRDPAAAAPTQQPSNEESSSLDLPSQ